MSDPVGEHAAARTAEEQKRLRAELAATRKRLFEAEQLREYLFGLTRPALSVPRWTLRTSPAKASEHIPVLVTSDLHWGESIAASRMAGVNAYDANIAAERYRLLITKTVDIGRAHLPLNSYPGIVLLRLGDMVSGEIHADIRESNDLQAVPAIRALVVSEAWGIRTLLEAFGSVWVISVSGNHGRTTPKPQFKRGGLDSYDALAASWLESLFMGEKRVSFFTPDSQDALFLLYGRRYVATHGDRMGSKGGKGFIGPAATILRGMKRMHDKYAALNTPLDRIFCGHFHEAYDLLLGWSNGSLPGYSEFAEAGGFRPSPPVQWLVMFHAKYGPTSQWPLLTAPAPTLADAQVVRPFEVAR